MGYNNGEFYVKDGNAVAVTTTWQKVTEEQIGRTFLKVVNTGAGTVNLAFGGGPSGASAILAAKAAPPVPGVEPGDHVYVQHPRRGPIAIKVLAHGRDGLQGECDMGERHRVPWSDVLGHKARQLQNYTVVDQGADGAILQDEKGRRRYMAGGGVGDEAPKPATPAPLKQKRDDPLLDGMDRLAKSLCVWGQALASGDVLFMKADPVTSRPGLTLKPVTDKRGVQTKRWVRSVPEEAKERPAASSGDQGASSAPAAPDAPVSKQHAHGDQVQWRDPDGEGKGTIIASGRDGVTVKDPTGKEHQVRHEHLVNPGQTATPAENDTKVAKPPVQGAPSLFSDEMVDSLPAKAPQPFKDEESLYKASGEALKHLKQWLDKGKGVCAQLGYETMKGSPDDADMSKPGGMLFIAPLKGKKRATEKVKDDYGGDWSQLRDVTRGTIAVDTLDDMKKCLDMLTKSGMKLAMKPKDRFAEPLPVGYRDVLMNIEFPNGVIGEMQLHVKAMLKAKSAGHTPYEVMRTIKAKPEAEWSAEERADYQKAFDESVDIYDKAWSECQGDAGREETMKKAMGLEGAAWDFFDHDGAVFRRPRGNIGPVTHVHVNGSWQDYKGDGLMPSLFGDRCDDPEKGDSMSKAHPILFLKADVAGYTTRKGTFVAPHTDKRPIGQWHVHKTHADGSIEHRKILSVGKPAFAGSGTKMRVVHEHPDGNVFGKSEHGYTSRHKSVDEAKAHLDRE
jgi:hypothetical protein